MRYQVPQFIEVEDKIIGPFTVKQFIYIAGGMGMSFIIYTYLPTFASVLLIGIVVPLSLALAFYKINNKPFIDFLESAFLFYTKEKLYIWKKEEKKIESKEIGETEVKQLNVPRLSDSKLKELSWTLDINENIKMKDGENNTK